MRLQRRRAGSRASIGVQAAVEWDLRVGPGPGPASLCLLHHGNHFSQRYVQSFDLDQAGERGPQCAGAILGHGTVRTCLFLALDHSLQRQDICSPFGLLCPDLVMFLAPTAATFYHKIFDKCLVLFLILLLISYQDGNITSRYSGFEDSGFQCHDT